MDVNPNTAEKSCSICGMPFHCGCQCEQCWCADYPAIMPPDFSRDCQCSSCLAKSIGKHIEQKLDTLSLDDALALAKPFAGNKRLIEGIDYRIENGLWIFSRWYLLKRGYCCGEACKHCPYSEEDDQPRMDADKHG